MYWVKKTNILLAHRLVIQYVSSFRYICTSFLDVRLKICCMQTWATLLFELRWGREPRFCTSASWSGVEVQDASWNSSDHLIVARLEMSKFSPWVPHHKFNVASETMAIRLSICLACTICTWEHFNCLLQTQALTFILCTTLQTNSVVSQVRGMKLKAYSILGAMKIKLQKLNSVIIYKSVQRISKASRGTCQYCVSLVHWKNRQGANSCN